MYCKKVSIKKFIASRVISIKIKKPYKISYIFDKTLALSIICDKGGSNNEEIFKDEESIKILETLGLINNMNE